MCGPHQPALAEASKLNGALAQSGLTLLWLFIWRASVTVVLVGVQAHLQESNPQQNP